MITKTASSKSTSKAAGRRRAAAVRTRKRISFTIGIPCSGEHERLAYSLNALFTYHDCSDIEILIVDDEPSQNTEDLISFYQCKSLPTGEKEKRQVIFENASNDFVLCLLPGVMLFPKVIDKLKVLPQKYHNDLIQGPIRNFTQKQTHYESEWSEDGFGVVANSEIEEVREIPMQKLDLFFCRRDNWVGSHYLGHDEGYVHEKFRQAGRRCLCAPWLLWNTQRKRLKPNIPRISSYFKMWNEIGWDVNDIVSHFSRKFTVQKMLEIAEKGLGFPVALTFEELDR